MRRLNVQFSQIEECIEKALFAVDTLPQNPPLEPGEILLLQLVKVDARNLGKLESRIEFGLVFDHVIRDSDGEISRRHWPNAGKVWRYILVCRETVSSLPFSLEALNLAHDYAGQTQCFYVEPGDAAIIAKYFRPDLAIPSIRAIASPRVLLRAIHNYDAVIRLSPEKLTKVSEHTRRINDPWPGDALKTLYAHKCQICTHDFLPRYGVAHSETRFITNLAQGGSLESKNRIVVCPNHNAIISVTRPRFDSDKLAFEYENGLTERLLLREHLLA
jgi:hypothetical protein